MDVPLELQIPTLDIQAAVLGVGITSARVMDAPMGPPGDPVWQKAFWFRGGGIPGDVGTSTIAGHVSGGRGPSLFARLKDLQPGDTIVVRDTRSGLDVRFDVTETKTYSVEQASEPAVLARIYGDGPVAGRGPQPAHDGLSHLALVTCAGTRTGGSYQSRFVVYATRTG